MGALFFERRSIQFQFITYSRYNIYCPHPSCRQLLVYTPQADFPPRRPCLCGIMPLALIKERTCNEYTKTSTMPSQTLTAINSSILFLAAIGVKIVSTAVPNIPAPNTHFPPNFLARSPPGTCVRTKPK